MGYLVAQQLVAADEPEVDVPAMLASRVRVLGTWPVDEVGSERRPLGGDRRAAGSVVGGGTARGSHHGVWLLAKRHTDVAPWRTKLCCRLHALVGELMTGGISKEVVVTQARSLLNGIQPGDVAAVERHRLAVELVDEIEHLDVVVRIRGQVSAPPSRRRERH
jgi:hypothetical protein